MIKKLFGFSLVLTVAISASQAFASVTLFQAGQPVRQIQDDLKLSSSAYRGIGQLNKGTAGQETLRFLQTNAAQFGIRKIDGESLELRKVHGGPQGFSLRYIQRFNRVKVEGAEIIAVFDANGVLRSLNSSLIPTPTITVQPTISRQDAYRAAVTALKYEEPELGDGFNDGLLIVLAPRGNPILVWQFSIREYRTGEKLYQVQVGASGAGAGLIYKVLNAAHSVESPTVNIYDASIALFLVSPIYKGVKVLKNGEETLRGKLLLSDVARNANANLQSVLGFYQKYFGRTSYDGLGAEINASVNVMRKGYFDILGMKVNAAWIGPFKMFAFGAGDATFSGFESALDVVGHEFTHAVIEKTCSLAYQGQSGGLNESLADVFGAIINKEVKNPANPFLIGETVLHGEAKAKAQALRDMIDPAKGFDPQPVNMKQVPDLSMCKPGPTNDNCFVHSLSGIPNRAFALTVKNIGWETAAPLFYRVMTGRLRSSSQFGDYRNQVLAECLDTLHDGRCDGVKAAFGEVGL